MDGWRNGRRTSFRSWHRKVWGFKSPPVHRVAINISLTVRSDS